MRLWHKLVQRWAADGEGVGPAAPRPVDPEGSEGTACGSGGGPLREGPPGETALGAAGTGGRPGWDDVFAKIAEAEQIQAEAVATVADVTKFNEALAKSMAMLAAELEAAAGAGSGPGTKAASASRLEPSSPRRIAAYALGEARVLLDGRELPDGAWRSRKSKEMFFYLLSDRRKKTKGEIEEALWPDLPPGKERATFHTALYGLRRAAGTECLLHDRGSYCLNPKVRCWYDLQEFHRLLDEADKLAPGSESRADKLRVAVNLYGGPFLEGVYSEWRETVARAVDQQYARALALLAGYHAGRKEYQQAVSFLERLVAVEPYDGDAHCELMKCYIAQGDPTSARYCYKRYERTAREELGTRPSARLVDLYASLKAG